MWGGLIMYIGRLWGGGVGGGVSKCSLPADFKLPATPRKHRCPQDVYIYIYVCVSRSCLADTVLT